MARNRESQGRPSSDLGPMVEDLKLNWKPLLRDRVASADIEIQVRGEIFCLDSTAWVERINECLPILIDQRALTELLNSKTKREVTSGSASTILPIKGLRELTARLKELPPTPDPPLDGPDQDGHCWWTDQEILWIDRHDALKKYVEIRRAEPGILLHTFAEAIRTLFEEEGPGKATKILKNWRSLETLQRDQAAAILGRSTRTVFDYIRKGQLSVAKNGRVTTESLKRFLGES